MIGFRWNALENDVRDGAGWKIVLKSASPALIQRESFCHLISVCVRHILINLMSFLGRPSSTYTHTWKSFSHDSCKLMFIWFQHHRMTCDLQQQILITNDVIAVENISTLAPSKPHRSWIYILRVCLSCNTDEIDQVSNPKSTLWSLKYLRFAIDKQSCLLFAHLPTSTPHIPASTLVKISRI